MSLHFQNVQLQTVFKIFSAAVRLTSLHFQNVHANSIKNILSSSPIDVTAFSKCPC